MEFKIGDRVQVKEYANIPDDHRTKGIARLHGKVGVVTDKLYSETNLGFVYRIHFDGYERPSNKMWTDKQLYILIETPVEYRIDFEYLENVVVARLCEVRGDKEAEIERGHGHVIHQGALGIAQAASYALKKLYKKMNGGNLS